jgi:hypothetical protein
VAHLAEVIEAAAPVSSPFAGSGQGHPGIVLAANEQAGNAQVALRQLIAQLELHGIGRGDQQGRHHLGNFLFDGALGQVVCQRQAAKAVGNSHPVDVGPMAFNGAANLCRPCVHIRRVPVCLLNPYRIPILRLQPRLPVCGTAVSQAWDDQDAHLRGGLARQQWSV